MNIPTKPQQSAKQLWIGMVEVRAARPTDVLAGAKGAFVNLVTWAANANDLKNNAELVLSNLGLFIVNIENPEPVETRRKKAELEDEIEDMITRALNNPNAIIYGTFHTWTRDDA